MADEKKNPSTEPAKSTPATMAELKTHFPGERHMAFREECMEKSLDVPGAKALMGEKLMAERDIADKATAEKQKKDAALGGAGISRGAPGGAPAEMAHGDKARAFTKAELTDPSTGRIGPVPGATSYQQAVAAYQSSGMKLHEAQYNAQVHHRDLWLDAREKDGENYMALHGDRERKKAKEMAGARR